jgi:hypothetical protein
LISRGAAFGPVHLRVRKSLPDPLPTRSRVGPRGPSKDRFVPGVIEFGDADADLRRVRRVMRVQGRRRSSAEPADEDPEHRECPSEHRVAANEASRGAPRPNGRGERP